MSLTIAINGFGRIGRTFLRSIIGHAQAQKKIHIAAINLGPHAISNLDILVKYDSLMGQLQGTVTVDKQTLSINGHDIRLITESDPSKINWAQFGIDWVVDASGCFTDGNLARQHCDAGARKVLITAPAEHEDITIIPGVNDKAYDKEKHTIVSLGSCTTNCFAPVVKVLHEAFQLEQGLMTTTHAYTNDQVLLDVEHNDPRRARAAGINIIPTKTGADRTITKIFPELEGKIRATSIRVPVPLVSLLDFSFVCAKPIDKESINQAFKVAAHGYLKSVIEYCDAPLVSSDFISNEASAIFDSLLTQSVQHMGKVFAWYDNEFGYSCRLRDFLLHNS